MKNLTFCEVFTKTMSEICKIYGKEYKMFWDILLELCEQHGIKPNPLAKLLGISSGAVTRWKRGSMPNDSTLLKIANYFGVTIAYLKGEGKSHDFGGAGERKEEVFNRNGAGANVELNTTKQLLLELGITSENELVCLNDGEYLRVHLKDEYKDFFKIMIQNSDREQI